MNIIKFKDTVKVGDNNFNKHLKGKYAYWIDMRYAIPFEFITDREYIALSRSCRWIDDPCKKEGEFYWDTERGYINTLIDIEATEAVNSVAQYVAKNNFSTDETLTICDLKVFRTWLAKQLICLNTLDEDQLHILNYYAGGMFDDTVKILSKIDPTLEIPASGSEGSCSVCSRTDYTLSAQQTVCNPLGMYREYIYKKMVEMFSNLEFWTEQYSDFLWEFKHYIDNIIRVGWTIGDDMKGTFDDCCCNNSKNDYFQDIMKRLSQSLEYILNGDTCGHKLYMMKAFTDFASLCYEKMYWA